ncbi:hypothetical protein BDV97DRAFT_396832 [Delphinella strobiligena]|nr:hypothetical protein BDV97DRAFT_396832 [Delphinella strobiligena]
MAFGQNSAFYMPTLHEVEAETLRLFEAYSKIPANQVVPHIEAIRERAWKVFPYPCIGGFHFIELSLSELPIYPEVLSRVQSGESFLDVGCCFGQDIRKLVFDGAPSNKIYGSDLDHRFLET